MDTGKPMSLKRILIILFLFFTILLIFRLGWLFYHQVPEHPQAESGVVNLTEWEFTDAQAITLDGDLIASEGNPTKSAEDANSYFAPYSALFQMDVGTTVKFRVPKG